jgi:ATP-binding protein involved in chromosome partitioning
MLNREQVLDALSPVKEPFLNRSLVELNWIRDIVVKEHELRLTVALSEEDETRKQELEQEIKQRLKEIGAPETYVRFRLINEFERQQLEQQSQEGNAQTQQRGKAAAGPMRHHGQPLPSEILKPDSGVKFIAIASGKGGVGKSTVTVNLAVALARRGKKVGIIDADIYGFSVPDMMGIETRPEVRDNKVIPVERFGVKVISMGFFVKDNSPVVWRGPMLGKMLRNFFAEIEWKDVEYILLDLPPGTGDVALDVHQMIPQSKEIIVTTPHATAAFVAARAGAMALQTDHEILGVVENMSYYVCSACGEKEYIFGRGGGAKLAEELHTELLAQIPLGAPDNHPSEPDFSPSVYKADSETGKIYLEMADRVLTKLES